jgi:16S rRNA C1402 (ribose-2'-O) methylase RsmI
MDNQIFKTNIVFGSMPIGNPYDISLNNIMHINNADIILIEHQREFDFFINNYNKIKQNNFYFPEINVKAKIYQYNLQDNFFYSQAICEELIKKSEENKILCLSDEGSSVFLEPGNLLKHMCIKTNKNFSVLSGPNSVISTITNSIYNFTSFTFLGTFDDIVHDEFKKFNIIKMLDPDILIDQAHAYIFLINGPQMLDGIKFLYDNFNNDWLIDFAINLTTNSETHVYSTIEKFYSMVKNNNKTFFNNKLYENRFAITLISKSYDYLPDPEKFYNLNKSDILVFEHKNIHEL